METTHQFMYGAALGAPCPYCALKCAPSHSGFSEKPNGILEPCAFFETAFLSACSMKALYAFSNASALTTVLSFEPWEPPDTFSNIFLSTNSTFGSSTKKANTPFVE